MTSLRRWISLVILLSLPHSSVAQSGWADWNQQNPADNSYRYFMDSFATCGKTFQLGSSSAQILGKGGGEPNESPTSCTITLSTDAVREERKFSIEVAAAQIYDTGVNFYIYDGQSSAGVMLDSFSYLKAPGPNFKKIITSGGFVTFVLTRESSASSGYDIRVELTVVAGDVPNPDNCIDGKGLGCENYYYNPVITKEQITAIVGGLFGVIIFVIIPLIVLYCYCKQKGVVKRWDEYKLDGHTNTAASIAGSSKATSYKEPWASQGSRRPYASIRRSPVMSPSRMSHTSEEDDSVFDDIPKRPAPPPPYEEHDRYDRFTRNNRDDFYDRKERSYNDEKYRRDDRNDRRGNRNSAPPPKTPKYRYGDAAENSYVQGDDDHPQDKFIERVIEPRVKSNARNKKRHQDEDETYDSIDETKKRVLKSESEPEKTDTETQCDKESDTDESPETESEYDSSSEEESEEESEVEEKTDPRKALYAEPNKAKKSTQKVKKKGESQPDKVALPKQAAAPQLQQPPVSQPVPLMYTGAPLPGVHGMRMVAPGMPLSGMPRPGMPIHQPGTQPMAFVPNQHQNIRPIHFPNQYNPVVAQQNQFHPVPSMQRPPVSIPKQQQHHHPSQSHKFSHPQQLPHVKPMVNQAEPPVYSYLVQRGYTPLDTGRHSPVSTSTGISHHSDYHGDDSDVQANLGSGVDLMKRTTEV